MTFYRGLPDRLFGKPVTDGLEAQLEAQAPEPPVARVPDTALSEPVPVPDPALAQYLTPKYGQKVRMYEICRGLVGGLWAGGILSGVAFATVGGEFENGFALMLGSQVLGGLSFAVLNAFHYEAKENVARAIQAYGAGGVP